ncbi:hypothetical protein AVEN_152519-1 [Araneus ventricosus]|uniref:Uncharacterized protein n=1 Tax=Araneus ventricosus TaxID=182803 RepID=A0A4Y2R9Y5_ARAVE|nr:hypothetical protein AVEN_205723-1 [Araneus ventricosus]GBN72234.1 hypothetical protein AVEN_58008-1 [Araneus ventricosus]GBN72247.1 hypothetical protein AVEN_110540-1 [Araneus ventricosus]GBN72256.1 hypothetical protein AVEN_152519-1 [Araneus ventricosus]
MCIVVSFIGCGTITEREQIASRRRGFGRRRIATTADDSYLLQCTRRRKTQTERQMARSSLLLQEGPYPAKPRRTDCMKEDCSHDDLLFVRLCPQRTSECGCIVPVNIEVRHQISGVTYSLRMSLDLTLRTNPEGQ